MKERLQETSGIPTAIYDFLYREHGYDRLKRYVDRFVRNSIASEDFVQDVLLQVIKQYPKTPPYDVHAWIWAIARNKANDYSKERLRERDFLAELQTLKGGPQVDDLSDPVLAHYNIQAFFEQLARDRPELAKTLFLFVAESRTLSQIAGILGRSEASTRRNLLSALQMLRSHVGG